MSLSVDTPQETEEFLDLLARGFTGGIKIDDIDLGDMETLRRQGEEIGDQTFQRRFLTTVAFRQVDSFQFADHARAFEEGIGT